MFEVEKQRGALKRQAARARRYKRLREELRKWEQVQFARRYEALAERDCGRRGAAGRGARAREAAAAAHVAELESALEALRLELDRGRGARDGQRASRRTRASWRSGAGSSRSSSIDSRSRIWRRRPAPLSAEARELEAPA